MEKNYFEKTSKPVKRKMDIFFLAASLYILLFVGLCVFSLTLKFNVLILIGVIFLLWLSIFLAYGVLVWKKKHNKNTKYHIDDTSVTIEYATDETKSLKISEIRTVHYKQLTNGAGDIFLNFEDSMMRRMCVLSAHSGFDNYERFFFALFEIKNLNEALDLLKQKLPKDTCFIEM